MSKRPDPSAKERVLRAALAEFAARGYEAASTNTIAAQAGVAKGLVFHHFGSKEQLFLAVVQAVLHEVRDALLADAEALPRELFERLHAWHVRKVALMQARPEVFEVFVAALTEAPGSLRREITRAQQRVLEEAWPRVLEGVDATRLRPGLSLADAVETLSLLAEGLERQLLSAARQRVSLDELSARAWVHFARVRDGLYASEPEPRAGSKASRRRPG